MTIEVKLAQATKKMRQVEHQKILQENREKTAESKINFRRTVIVGELFIKHFPIAMHFFPGKTNEESGLEFKALDNFLGALAQCHQLYQEIENKRSKAC